MLVSSHVMAHPDPSKPYILYTDASNTCIGAILVQKDKAGVERVIQYVSHQLSPTQQRWSTVEVEAWAIVYALQKLRTYLFGADFTVYSDHKPLMSLFSGKEMQNTKLQRWAILLAEFGAKIKYLKGSSNTHADMLSRLPPNQISVIDSSTPYHGPELPADTEIKWQVLPTV